MKPIFAIILIMLFSFCVCLYFPWWSIAIAAFLSVLLIPLASGRAFLAGFLGVFLLWFLLALWIDIKNQHILSTKIARIFPLGGSSFAILLVTAFIGALVGGLGALSGSYLRKK